MLTAVNNLLCPPRVVQSQMIPERLEGTDNFFLDFLNFITHVTT